MGVYRVGYCPVCGTQIKVQDENGRFVSIKPNFREIDMGFEDGGRIRTMICSDCLSAGPDYQEIMTALTGNDSEAFSESTKEKVKKRGFPTSWVLSKGRQGSSL